MSRVGFCLATAAGAAIGGAVLLAYKISRETGKTLTEAAAEVPAEAMRYWEEARARALEALDAGRQAARRKEDEIEQSLSGEA